jgi:hypothetical protein
VIAQPVLGEHTRVGARGNAIELNRTPEGLRDEQCRAERDRRHSPMRPHPPSDGNQ